MKPVAAVIIWIIMLTGPIYSGPVWGQEHPEPEMAARISEEPDSLLYLAPGNMEQKYRDALNHLFTIDLQAIPLEEAIVAIAEKGGFRVAFSRDALNIDWHQPVTVRYDRATLLGALYRLLYDLDIHNINIAFSTYGLLVLVPNHQDIDDEYDLVRIPLLRYGTISGQVTDEVTGEVMPGAHVILEGTRMGAVVDQDGRFVIRRVPEGFYEVTATYLGYRPYTALLEVKCDSRVNYDMMLKEDLITGHDVQIIAHLRGQARAMTRQRKSVNIRSVISSEQIDRFTTMTVGDVLSRVTGMHGASNIRGVGNAMSNVTVDGQRMGTTGTGSRSVDLGTISVDMVRELEVIKVITPDMDADALSGVINISTRRPVGGTRELDVRLGGGAVPRYYRHSGAGARAAISFGDTPDEKFSYAVNFSYQRSPDAAEGFETDWEIMNFGNGPVDVMSYLSTELLFDPRSRYGSGLQLTFQPTERTSFHVQGMLNIQEREERWYGTSYRPRVESYVSQNATSREFGHSRGFIRYEARLQPYRIDQYTFRASARHLFSRFDMEYHLGWGYGRYDRDRYGFQFRSPTDYDYYVTLEDRMNPTIDIINRSFPGQNLFDLYYVENTWDEHRDNEISATVDFEVPHDRGSFKFGTGNRMTFKKGAFEDYRMNYSRRVNISQFEKYVNSDWHILGRDYHHTYHIPWMLDLESSRSFFYGQYPHMQLDRERWAERAETRNYRALEHTISGYAMGTFIIGRFTMLGGLRVEHTRNSYFGREGIINSTGRFQGAVDANSRNHYTRFFPNAQMVYGLGQMTNIRLAWSRSIGRPDFDQLAPYQLLNFDREIILRGNPDLRPMISDNLDFLIEHYFMNVGELTLGLYYKQLRDFVYLQDRRISEGTYSGWNERGFSNGESATVYGLEISWQQKLDFLPGFLENLGTVLNYTWSRSIADLDRDRERYGTFPLPGQRPYIVNAGLNYHQGRISAGAFYSWSAPVLASFGTLEWVPEIQLNERVWFDRYRIVSNQLSLSAGYRITPSISIWADANNILRSREIEYFYNRQFYPHQVRYNQTTNMLLGIRFHM